MEMEKEKLERKISKLEEKIFKLSREHSKQSWRYVKDITKTTRKLIKAGTFDSLFLNNKLKKLERESEEYDLAYERKSQKLDEELDNYQAMYDNLDKELRMIESEIQSFKENSEEQIKNKYGVEISFSKADINIVSNSNGKLAHLKNSITELADANKDMQHLIADLQRAKNEI